jgi:hypothetical protein
MLYPLKWAAKNAVQNAKKFKTYGISGTSLSKTAKEATDAIAYDANLSPNNRPAKNPENNHQNTIAGIEKHSCHVVIKARTPYLARFRLHPRISKKVAQMAVFIKKWGIGTNRMI